VHDCDGPPVERHSAPLSFPSRRSSDLDPRRRGAPAGEPELAPALEALRKLVAAGAKPRAASSVVASLTGVKANALYRALTEEPGAS
jgi:hypothetical protein